MNTYALGISAEEDLNEIWDYIARDDVEAADRWIRRLFESFETLAKTPGMGHRREDLTALPVLFWTVGSYVIVYRAGGDGIEIVAITQGSRNVPVFLQQRT